MKLVGPMTENNVNELLSVLARKHHVSIPEFIIDRSKIGLILYGLYGGGVIRIPEYVMGTRSSYGILLHEFAHHVDFCRRGPVGEHDDEWERCVYGVTRKVDAVLSMNELAMAHNKWAFDTYGESLYGASYETN